MNLVDLDLADLFLAFSGVVVGSMFIAIAVAVVAVWLGWRSMQWSVWRDVDSTRKVYGFALYDSGGEVRVGRRLYRWRHKQPVDSGV